MKSDDNVMGKGIEAIFQKTAHLRDGDSKTLELPNGTITREGDEIIIRLRIDCESEIRTMFDDLSSMSSSGMLDQLVDVEKARSQLRDQLELATIAWDEKDYQAAIDEYLEVLKVHNHADVYFNIALLYEKLKKIDLAVKQYKKVLKIQPRYVAALNNLALIYYAKNDLTNAMDYYQRAIHVDSSLSSKGDTGDLFAPRFKRKKIRI